MRKWIRITQMYNFDHLNLSWLYFRYPSNLLPFKSATLQFRYLKKISYPWNSVTLKKIGYTNEKNISTYIFNLMVIYALDWSVRYPVCFNQNFAFLWITNHCKTAITNTHSPSRSYPMHTNCASCKLFFEDYH